MFSKKLLNLILDSFGDTDGVLTPENMLNHRNLVVREKLRGESAMLFVSESKSKLPVNDNKSKKINFCRKEETFRNSG